MSVIRPTLQTNNIVGSLCLVVLFLTIDTINWIKLVVTLSTTPSFIAVEEPGKRSQCPLVESRGVSNYRKKNQHRSLCVHVCVALIGANCLSLSSFYLAHAISRMTPVQVTWLQVGGGLIDSVGEFNEV